MNLYLATFCFFLLLMSEVARRFMTQPQGCHLLGALCSGAAGMTTSPSQLLCVPAAQLSIMLLKVVLSVLMNGQDFVLGTIH